MTALTAIILLLSLAAHVSACYSGLTLIPTAETVGDGVLSIEQQIDGSMSPVHADTHILNTQFGLGDRFEAGVDFDLSDEADARALVNAKYVLLPHPRARLALAAGVCNINTSLRSVPYLTCCAHSRGSGLHFGIMRTDGKNRWFTGVHRPLLGGFCFMADYIAGEENFSAVGLEYEINDRWGVLIGQQTPNGSGDRAFTFHLIFSRSLPNW